MTLWERIANAMFGEDEPDEGVVRRVDQAIEGVVAWLKDDHTAGQLGHCEPYVEVLIREARREP